jgi:hypothetical protein
MGWINGMEESLIRYEESLRMTWNNGMNIHEEWDGRMGWKNH